MATSRVVVITGGGSGMGAAMAKLFAKNGDQVYVLGRNIGNLKSVSNFSKLIEPIKTDVTKPKDIEAAVKTITKRHKKIDVLINCAGSSGTVPSKESLENALEAWEQIIKVNLTGTFSVTYAFLEHIAKPGGRIINITSVAALQGSSRPGGEAYAAAKAGIHGLSRTLVKELSPHGVTVNCIAPGLIENTDFFGDAGLPEDVKQKYLAAIPVKRLGQPEEVAAAAFYLASADAGFVNGEILNINGGSQFGR